jgi:hypothetical protein
MSKMTILFKVQKPEKNQAKNCIAEQFIKATDKAFDTRKLILEDIQAIIQKIIEGKTLVGTNKRDDVLTYLFCECSWS